MNEPIEIIEHKVRCPICRSVSMYQFSVKKTSVHAFSLFGLLIPMALSAFALLIILSHDWRIFVLGIGGTLVVATTDSIVKSLLWRCAAYVTKKSELTFRKFTVRLECEICKVPFQASISLPVQREKYNEFKIITLEA